MDELTRRYPSQDQEESIEVYQVDFERLALRYSLNEVQAALAEYRITPGASFFPRPDEIARVVVERRDAHIIERQRASEAAERIRQNRERWDWFDDRIRNDGQCYVNGQVCRTDEDFLKALKSLKPRNYGVV
jgi:hypothetical protein